MLILGQQLLSHAGQGFLNVAVKVLLQIGHQLMTHPVASNIYIIIAAVMAIFHTHELAIMGQLPVPQLQ